MKPIIKLRLLRGETAIINAEDYELVNNIQWHLNGRYVRGRISGTPTYLHWVIAGHPLKGYHVHHRNGNRLDNRRENLEVLSETKHIQITNSIPISQYSRDMELICVFSSAREAHRKTGIACGNIKSAALGLRKTAGGYIWVR